MKTLNLLLAVLALVVVSSCSSVRSTTQEGVNLDKYISFTLAENDKGYLPQLSVL